MRLSNVRSPARAVRPRTRRDQHMNSAPRRPAKPAARAAERHTRKAPPMSSPLRRRAPLVGKAAKHRAKTATGWRPSAAKAANTKNLGGRKPTPASSQCLERRDQLLDARLRERDIRHGSGEIAVVGRQVEKTMATEVEQDHRRLTPLA